MAELFYRDKQFIYKEQQRERVILDCGDYLSNNSRIPMHCLENQRIRTIPDILADLIEKGPYRGSQMGLGAALIDVLLAACLRKTSQPVKVLEYGCLGGKLSFHLAEMLGAFCEESSLVCACDIMDTEWMNVISGAENLPKISFLAGDYGHLQLQQKYFDMVLINGTINFADPCQVISDALKLITEDGVILCCCDDMPLLEDVFKLFFKDDKREDYDISDSLRIMTAKAKDSSWKTWEEESDFDGRAREHLQQAEALLAKASNEREKMADMAELLLQDAKSAGMKGNIELKIRLVKEREKLIDGILQ